MSQTAKCNDCGFKGHPDKFGACFSARHDLKCPKCETTDINTTGLLKDWPDYGYGPDNTLIMGKKSERK